MRTTACIIQNVNTDRALIRDNRDAVRAAITPFIGKTIYRADGGFRADFRAALPEIPGVHIQSSGSHSLVMRAPEAICYVGVLNGGVLSEVLSNEEQGSFPDIDPAKFEEAHARAKALAAQISEIMRPFSDVCHTNVNIIPRIG